MAGGSCFAFTTEVTPGAGTRIASTTIPAQNPPSVDTNVSHIQWMSLTIDGQVISPANPVPVTTSYDKILNVINASKWMELAVFDQVEFTANLDNTTINIEYFEDQILIGLAVVTIVDDKNWSFVLYRYIVDDDGSLLLDDDDTELLLE